MLPTWLITALLISAVGLYLVATVLIAKCIRAPDTAQVTNTPANGAKTSGGAINMAFGFGWAGTLAHLGFAYLFSVNSGAIDFSLSSMAVLISGLLALIFVLGGLSLPIRRLGVMVFPLTVACLLFAQLWGRESVALSNIGPAASLHIVVSILAYCLLAIASIQALLYVYQERQIKNRATPTMLMALPPLLTMELLLFRLIWTGFIFLTLTLISGAVFSHEIFGKPFEFKHHTILASLGWLVFAALLIKRLRQGLRGTQAVYWTVGGFALIQLGYFGTKIVSESLAVQ